ncbi:hypothetical protein I79_002755 [Cricetulus griseus]|uniref:Uncharacterized protein n=1 Tax=Cricetulus griseus TaxID=10029 RepID=G3GY82_CRIGR|nr:hypothetical protein I79_002755 [Cricetulus griseus]
MTQLLPHCTFKLGRAGPDLRQRLFWDTEVLNLALYSLRMFLKRGIAFLREGPCEAQPGLGLSEDDPEFLVLLPPSPKCSY